tara:strand:+ start:743 stop:1627 length:885 start_codon:yes stop_codon:yes gene_type:complete
MNCYNGSKYLKDSLESIINQTYNNWELIFWDNRSTDNSAKIFLSYKDKRFKYYLSDKHTPLAEARNLAIRNSSGEFLAFLDVDDTWEPSKLVKQIVVFENKDVGLSYSNFFLLFNNEKKLKVSYKKKQPSGFILKKLLVNYNIAFLTVIIRKEAYEKLNNKFNSNFSIIEDLDIVIRISINWKIKYVDSLLGNCRIHANNYQRTFFNQKFLEFQKIILNFDIENNISNLKEYKTFKKNILRDKIIYNYLLNNKKNSFSEIIKLNNIADFMKIFLLFIIPKKIMIKYFKSRNPYL